MSEATEVTLPEQVNPEQPEEQRVAESVPAEGTEAAPGDQSTSRPVTRSQTGRVSKRRVPTEASGEPKKRSSPATKKQKTVSRQTSASGDADGEGEDDPSVLNPTLPIISPPEGDSEAPPASSSRMPQGITFLEVSTAADAQGDRRISRSRAVFPVPVPNLTKKSRGRRVPTSQNMDTAPVQPEKRVYICKVDGCGKCFHRGEHLKRHIRSIHTHEKPFKCTYPQCGKFFNRHDNLLQHLKVHKETKASRSQKATSNASEPGTPPPSRPPSQMREQPESPNSEGPDSPLVPRPRTIYDHQPNLYAGYANTGPFESPAESMRFVTNMAVSSLRTEIPQSPTEPHPAIPAQFAWHRPENVMQDQLTY
ncbi:hypothetical protein DFP72DRAFT_575157 [Ephemerocybe angulata]|uniref:C2H2-type domain-containing protein n=1 Tax=Ephemerocybe angulata TaxID=980116 RepID=A0A8H6HME9_9AGAR|nr:hypothetical protein DFP72DRAFT_575157 [Tulosesus angulatus]